MLKIIQILNVNLMYRCSKVLLMYVYILISGAQLLQRKEWIECPIGRPLSTVLPGSSSDGHDCRWSIAHCSEDSWWWAAPPYRAKYRATATPNELLWPTSAQANLKQPACNREVQCAGHALLSRPQHNQMIRAGVSSNQR